GGATVEHVMRYRSRRRCVSSRAARPTRPTIARSFDGAPAPPRGIRLAGTASMAMGIKVFTATKAKEREALGEAVTHWLQENPRAHILERCVTQSSDSQFHCLTITLMYENGTAPPPEK